MKQAKDSELKSNQQLNSHSKEMKNLKLFFLITMCIYVIVVILSLGYYFTRNQSSDTSSKKSLEKSVYVGKIGMVHFFKNK